MTINVSTALTRAWNRMITDLFKPFDLHKWLVVGFTAFLAGLANGHSGSSGWRGRRNVEIGDFLGFPHRALGWLQLHPFWFAVVVTGLILAVVVAVLFLWLSSRGKFMFLDNVAHRRSEIAKPWHEHRKEADSLFVWRLVFGLISFAVFAAVGASFFLSAVRVYNETRFSPVPILWILALTGTFLVIGLAVGAIALLLNEFVVPIMYRNRVSASHAWKQFLPVFWPHLGSYILYALIVFALLIAFVFAIVVAGLVTCCIGWFLLVIPYVGTVVTLPFWYWLRAFGPEFLAQFGWEYDIFPPAAATPTTPPAA